MLKKAYAWINMQIDTPYADHVLALLSFLEAIIFPPVAPLLVLYCIQNRNKVYTYALIATVFSVLGGIIMFLIGLLLWETVGNYLVSFITTPIHFANLCELYKKYASWAVLIGSFSPFPYKALGIAAGFCQLSLVPFIIFSLIGRAARYFLIAWTLRLWGPSVRLFIDQWFYHLVFLFLVLIGLSLLVLFVI